MTPRSNYIAPNFIGLFLRKSPDTLNPNCNAIILHGGVYTPPFIMLQRPLAGAFAIKLVFAVQPGGLAPRPPITSDLQVCCEWGMAVSCLGSHPQTQWKNSRAAGPELNSTVSPAGAMTGGLNTPAQDRNIYIQEGLGDPSPILLDYTYDTQYQLQ